MEEGAGRVRQRGKKEPPRLLQKFLCSVSFKKKLVFVYVFVVIVPTLLVGVFLTSRMHSMAIGRAVDQAVHYADQMEQRIGEMARLLTNVSDQLYLDEKLAGIVAKKYESSWAVVTAMKNYTTFDDYTNYYREIKDIRFYISAENLMGNYNYVRTTDDIKNYPWYQKTVEKRGMIGWNYVYDEEQRRLCLAQTRQMRDPNGLNMGVLVIQADELYLSSFFHGESDQTILVGEGDLIVAASDTGTIGQNLDSIGFRLLESRGSPGVFDCMLGDERAIAAIREISLSQIDAPLRVVSIFPTRYLLEEANRVIPLGFLIIFASLLIALALVVFFSTMLSRRIQVLCGEMHSIASGNLREQITVDGVDEIGVLSQDLSRMVRSINTLIEQVYVADMQKNQLLAHQKEIRFKMLSSQMNPHFLFNALESIRMSAHAAGNAQLATNVKLLGKIMRASLYAGEEAIALRREIEMVENYLLFQRFRFPDRLTYRIDRNDVDTERRILPFLLEPIVENSVVHGMERSSDPCEIHISLDCAGNTLSIRVADNGAGMGAREMARLRDYLEVTDGDGTHIGLRNVHQRIQLFYGRDYGLTIEENPGGGIVVTVRIPFGDTEKKQDVRTSGGAGTQGERE